LRRTEASNFKIFWNACNSSGEKVTLNKKNCEITDATSTWLLVWLHSFGLVCQMCFFKKSEWIASEGTRRWHEVEEDCFKSSFIPNCNQGPK
jgi:hypothetical protein